MEVLRGQLIEFSPCTTDPFNSDGEGFGVDFQSIDGLIFNWPVTPFFAENFQQDQFGVYSPLEPLVKDGSTLKF